MMRKAKLIASLCAAAFLAGCAHVPVNGVVTDDMGGPIGQRAATISAVNAQRLPIEIRGKECASSCVMYLAADNVCVDRSVVFWLHGPRARGALVKGDSIFARMAMDNARRIYAAHLPPDLAKIWFATVAYDNESYVTITAAEAVARGWVKWCPPASD